MLNILEVVVLTVWSIGVHARLKGQASLCFFTGYLHLTTPFLLPFKGRRLSEVSTHYSLEYERLPLMLAMAKHTRGGRAGAGCFV